MARFLVQRFLVALIRLVVVLGILGLITEFAVLFTEGGGHIWNSLSADSLPDEFGRRLIASFRVIVICWTIVIIIGLGIGIFRARLRRARGLDVIWFPILALSWAPAFWLIGLVVLWVVEQWGHPGFADGQQPIGKAAINEWWHAMILGVILAAGAIGWQFRHCTAGIRDGAKQEFVLTSAMRGHRHSTIFYDHVLRNSMEALTGVVDRGLPATLGMLAVAEWAFHYRGIGQFMIESARAGLPAQMFVGAAIFAAVAVFATLMAEWILGTLDRRVRP